MTESLELYLGDYSNSKIYGLCSLSPRMEDLWFKTDEEIGKPSRRCFVRYKRKSCYGLEIAASNDINLGNNRCHLSPIKSLRSPASLKTLAIPEHS